MKRIRSVSPQRRQNKIVISPLKKNKTERLNRFKRDSRNKLCMYSYSSIDDNNSDSDGKCVDEIVNESINDVMDNDVMDVDYIEENSKNNNIFFFILVVYFLFRCIF